MKLCNRGLSSNDLFGDLSRTKSTTYWKITEMGYVTKKAKALAHRPSTFNPEIDEPEKEKALEYYSTSTK